VCAFLAAPRTPGCARRADDGFAVPIEGRPQGGAPARVLTNVLEAGVTAPTCVVVVDGVSRTAVLSEDASRAALRLLAAHVAGGRALGEDVDACVSGDEAALVVRQLVLSRFNTAWRIADEAVIPLQVSRRITLATRLASAHSAAPGVRCMQVDAFAGFELRTAARVTAVEAAAAVGRSEVAALRGAVRVLRGDIAGAGSRRLVERVAALQAEVAALRAAAAEEVARRAAAEEAARRAAEEEAIRSAPTDPASLLSVATAEPYLRGKGFRAGAVPAGMTYGLATIGEAAITVKSFYANADFVKEPGIRLLYKPERPGQPRYCFYVGHAGVGIPDAWAQVDLGAPRTVLGVLTQGSHYGGDSAATGGHSWFTIRVQWSNDGATWTPAAGGRTWSRTGLKDEDVMPSVLNEPVRCRYVRVEGTDARNGCFRWEVVVQRE
jgi:hypothetical protein